MERKEFIIILCDVCFVSDLAPSESPRSPREECSLAANRAAYQEFLNASRKSDENEEKEALFERVERKDEKETNAEDLEVQDLSFDDL